MLMIASTESLRQQNRALVLAALRANGPISHTDIADLTNLSSSTVSAITGDLESGQILIRKEQPPNSGRGRPRVIFEQRPDAAYLALIRITSESIEYSLSDYKGTLKDRFTEIRSPMDIDTLTFVSRMKVNLQKLADRSTLKNHQILTISITSKGLVAPNRPILTWSPIFGEEQINFEEALQPEWSAHVRLTNETQFAALAIAMSNRITKPAEYTPKLATLSLGHAIGLGIASELSTGEIETMSPAFGHMMHNPDGPLCRCGEHGCIEAYSGFYGILRTAFEAPENSIPAKFVPLEEITKISVEARRGNHMAQYAFRSAGEAIGTGLSRLFTMFEPMPITITGPGVQFLDLMLESIRKFMVRNVHLKNCAPPNIFVDSDQSILVYQGNVGSCLADLDTNVIATRSFERAAK